VAINPMIEKKLIFANKTTLLPKLFWAMLENFCHQFFVIFQLALVAKLGDPKFGHPIFSQCPKKLSITLQRFLTIRWTMV